MASFVELLILALQARPPGVEMSQPGRSVNSPDRLPTPLQVMHFA